jgi:branched-chain amino acid transport system ATP-binding protein
MKTTGARLHDQATGSSDASALLSAEDVTAGYRAHEVLRNVSLEVREREIVSLLGHNGAGKSTLLRCLAGSVALDSGRVLLEGRDQNGRGATKSALDGVALVPQSRGVFPGLTIGENLQLGANLARRTDRHSAVSLELILELFPALADRLHEPAGALSGGQQQMVAIGTALMSCPKVLLLDEPSTGLAPVLVQTMLERIRQVHNEIGISVLIVEQSIHEAIRISDRAYVLKLGEIVRESPANTLLNDPDIWDLF